MAIVGLIYVLLVGLWIFLLPAWLISRRLVPRTSGVGGGLVAAVGFSTYPLLVFLSTVVLGIPMDAGWLIAVGTAVNFVLAWREQSRGTLALDVHPPR